MAENKKKTKRPTAEKRTIQNEKRRHINKVTKSKVRTAVRRFEDAVQSGDKSNVETELSGVFSAVDRAVKAGIFKINKASRTKARLKARAMAV